MAGEIDLYETEEEDDDDEENDEFYVEGGDEIDVDDVDDGINKDSYMDFVGLNRSDNDESEIDEEVKALAEDEDDNYAQEIDETKADNLAFFISTLDKKRKRTVDEEVDSLEKPKKHSQI